MNPIFRAVAVALCLFSGPLALQGSEQRVLYEANFSSLEASGLKLTKDWSAQDGLQLKSKDWWWETATIAVKENDFQLDAVVDICTNGPGQGNGAGFIVRSSAAGAAVFHISQPLAGYLAQAELIGKGGGAGSADASAAPADQIEKHTFYISPTDGRRLTKEELSATRNARLKNTVYALSKDNEVGLRHLRLMVKGSLANFYVDDQLACIIDLSDYPNGEVGLYGHYQVLFKSFTVRALPPDAKVFASRPLRDLLPDGQVYQSQQSWDAAIAQAGAGLDLSIAEGTEGVPGEETMPAFTYRCVTWMKPGVRPFYAYPAFHHAVFIKAMIDYSRLTKDPKYLKEAARLGEWNLRNSTPETFKLPHLPYSTTYNGKMGGNVDGDTVMLDKVGAMGVAYLRLYEVTKSEEFKTGAIKIAETLLPLQLPDGRWQNRVEPATGKVVQDYTSSQMFNIEFMERLHAITGEQRYADSAQRALQWVLNNPVKTYRWTGFYEDVNPDVESIGNWDAIDTARYLVRHRKDNPEYLKTAIEIYEWVATSYAVKQGGKWPMICEQTICMPVMSAHSFHFAQLCIDLNEATGEQYYHDVALSTVNSAFDFSRGEGDWYGLIFSPLIHGIEVAERLK